MINIGSLTCALCPEKVNKLKYLVKTKDGFICRKCNSKKRLQHREFLKREVLGIRKRSDLEKAWREKRKLKEAIAKRRKKELKEIKESKFTIKGYKAVRVFGRRSHKVSALGLYISRNEKEVLYRILIGKGYSSQEANEHIKLVCEKMSELSVKLNKEKRKKGDLNIIFKEEFAKLIERS